jgi:hypothetical protein
LRRTNYREEVLPRCDFGFPRAADDDVEVMGEVGEEADDFREDGVARGRRIIGFVVEDVVEEYFEGMRKVGEVFVASR